MKKTYSDFIQLIADGQYNDYQVCFESSSINKDIWTASDYLDYLCNLEHYKHETGISIQYDFFCVDDKVMCVDTFIHYPEEKDLPQRNHVIHWKVKRVK